MVHPSIIPINQKFPKISQKGSNFHNTITRDTGLAEEQDDDIGAEGADAEDVGAEGAAAEGVDAEGEGADAEGGQLEDERAASAAAVGGESVVGLEGKHNISYFGREMNMFIVLIIAIHLCLFVN